MKRKQLPKAIRRTDADLRVVSSEPDEEAPIPHHDGPSRSGTHELEGEILPPSGDVLPLIPAFTQADAEQRLRKAFSIVERHQLFSGLGGLFPVAAVNVASVTAVNLRMVKLLCDLYGVPFERDKARTVIIGLMGGAAPAGLAAATATTLVHVVPVAGAIGMAVSSVAAASLTRRIGVSYVERFEAATFVA